MFLLSRLVLFCCDDGDGSAADDCDAGGASTVFSTFFPNRFSTLFQIVFSFSVSDLFLAFFLHIQPFEYNQNDSLLP